MKSSRRVFGPWYDGPMPLYNDDRWRTVGDRLMRLLTRHDAAKGAALPPPPPAGTNDDGQQVQALAQQADALSVLITGLLESAHAEIAVFDADAGVRSALDHLIADVAQWRTSTQETATALRSCAERYVEAEAQAARALRPSRASARPAAARARR